MINFENIEIKYGDYVAVDNLNLEINEGEFFTMLGPSGCGKTTTLKMINGLIKPTSGKILIDGEDISKKNIIDLRRGIGYVMQQTGLFPHMTIKENIELVAKLEKVPELEREERVKELMDTVGLSERLMNTYPHELDGGRRQRIGIARALALKPKFIVCDEPVSALDVSIQAQVLNLMKDLQEEFGLTYMFITHDLSVVKHFSDDIAVMYLGQLVEKAPSKMLFKNPIHPYTKALLSAIPVPSVKKKMERIKLQGEITSPINPDKGCRFAKRCVYAKDICRQQEPALREVGEGHFYACHLAEELGFVEK